LAWAAENLPELDPAIVEAACAEGTIVLYDLPSAGAQAVHDQFQKDLPCLTVGGEAASLTNRFLSEEAAGKHIADVLRATSEPDLRSAQASGFILEWTPPNADYLPDDLKNEGFWYANSASIDALAWNTTAVSAEQLEQLRSVTQWSDLDKLESMAGAISVTTIASGGSGQAFWYTLYDTYGPDFLQDVADRLQPTVYPSVVEGTQHLTATQTPAIYGALDSLISAAYLDGAPLEWVYPTPAIIVPTFVTISANAPNPNAAKVFETWLLSKAGVEASVNLGPTNGLRDDIDDRRPWLTEPWYKPLAIEDLRPVDFEQLNAQLDAVTAQYDATVGAQ
jgi:ABC-type Fe3+ transport system substrate-binding protein